jgi:cell fate regulator YaaT (PSP1 superfamily)
LAQVVIAPQQVIASTLDGELRPIIRVATDDDLRMAEEKRGEQGAALRVFAAKIRDHGLPMKPISAEYAFDGSRLTLNFSANGRVDFRELVRDLARHFGCRIELRQIGPRDEARLLGGLGRCGRPLCCSTWLPQFADVSMTMAKTQDLSLNPDKVSGVCGKLLCCLSYENSQYAESRTRLPRLGQEVITEQGPGYVHALQILKETVTIRLDSGEDVVLAPEQLTVLSTTSDAAPRRGRRRVRRDSAGGNA